MQCSVTPFPPKKWTLTLRLAHVLQGCVRRGPVPPAPAAPPLAATFEQALLPPGRTAQGLPQAPGAPSSLSPQPPVPGRG